MDKPKEILRLIGAAPTADTYLKLERFITARLAEIQGQYKLQTDMDEVKRLQGRELELNDMLKGMTRRTLSDQHTGGFTG